MYTKNRLLRYISDIKREGFYPFITTRLLPIRKLRYRLVGLLYGHKFRNDIVKISQLEYLCGEIANQNFLKQPKFENIEVTSLLKLARDCLSNRKITEGLLLLDEAMSLDPNHPSLLEIYTDYYNQITAEIGLFKNLHFEVRLRIVELVRNQVSQSCFNLFNKPTKVLDRTWTGSIGLLATVAQYIQAKQLGLLPEGHHIAIVQRSVNDCYRDYIASLGEIDVICEEDYKGFYDHCFLPYSEDLHAWESRNGYEALFSMINKVQERWAAEKRPPLLKIKPDHRERGLKILEALNIPEDAWFVSLHVRSATTFDEDENNLHAGRSCDIDSYIPAVQAITDAGGYVFRMGDPTMKPLPKMPQVVDYALSSYKSDWMDVFLWACCRFFVGTNSGPAVVLPTFGVPMLWTNVTPFAICSITFPNSLMVPKLWYSQAEQRLLTFSEILACPAGWCQRRTLDDHLVLVDNTADELAAGVKEMIALTKDGIQEHQYEITKDPLNPLQMKLDTIREKYNTFGKLPVSRAFLNKYAHLIG
jgi:putative glycosyltransferase (TIGR04372 family)